MGAWSTKIFDDDGAADILAEYKILLGYGIPPKEAYQKVYDYFAEDYLGSDDEDVFWLGIALYQWKNGILIDEVKENALRCIDDGKYLERWKESGEKVYQKRKETLRVFKDKLLNEVNDKKKKFPKCPAYYRKKTNLKMGDLLAYIIHEPGKVTQSDDPFYSMLYKKVKELDKKIVLLRVVNVSKKPVTELVPELDHESWAEMMLYNWCGEEIPDKSIVDSLNFLPIVMECVNGCRKVVSNISLYDVEDINQFAEIIVLGNDNSFGNCIPDLYLENPDSPFLHCSSFNNYLAMTFLNLEGKDVWYYAKN